MFAAADGGGMMARMLTQLPLPLLPGNAREITCGVGVVDGPDGGGVVWVHGLATFAWDAGDEAARRLAAVQLWQLRAAYQAQVAVAFGVIPLTLWRWRKDLAAGGVAALIPDRKGPQRPSRLTPQKVAQIRELDGQGMRKAAIAAAAGVSETSVRNVLRAASAVEPAPQDEAPAAGEPADGPPAAEPAQEAPGQAASAGEPGGALPVLPDPVPRDGERALARFGLLGEGAAPAFIPGARYPLAGLLLALPALQQTGLLACARQVYGRLRDGYYSLDAVLVHLVLQALLREPRAEGATRVPPPAMGRVLGLDRAPEVKTIRREISELAAAGKAADLQMAIAQRRAQARPDELAIMYTDGHTRAYFGKRDVQKMHVARLKFPGPATEETWVTDGAGDPLLVVMAEPSSSLAAQIKELLPGLRQIAGQDARPTLCFDRGGWSPDLFADIIHAGFHLLTYRKASPGKDIPDLPADQFSTVTVTHTGDDGRAREYKLAESAAGLAIAKGGRKGETVRLRQVTRLDKGKQVHVLTDRQAGDLPAADVIYRMGSRWREENYLLGRDCFALDALDTYAVTAEDPDRKVPSPAKKAAAAAVKTAKKNLAAAQGARDAKLTALRSPAPGQPAVVITNQMLAKLDVPVATARRKLEDAQAAARAIPAKIPLSEHNPDMVRLDTETKLITHAIRMAAYNAETILARALDSGYARAGDEAYALIREALTTSGDIIPDGQTLHVRLDPLTAPRRTRALACLCDQLNATWTIFPGTKLTLRYAVKEHQSTT